MTPELPTKADMAKDIICLENTMLIVACLSDGDGISLARPPCGVCCLQIEPFRCSCSCIPYSPPYRLICRTSAGRHMSFRDN